MSWYPATVDTGPTEEPVTLTEAKDQTRVDGTADDGALNRYIAAARAHVEAYCGTPIISRTIEIKADSFKDFERFPIAPLQSVSSVTYVDTTGATQALSTNVYEVRSDGLTASLAKKFGQSWPDIREGSRITVTAVVGYEDVPDDIKHAMLLLISHWYENRSAVDVAMQSIPMGVDSLLCNHRVFTC